MFRRWKDFDVVENCPHCGIKLAEHDSGDGPAFFIIFFLSFIVAPLALWLEASVNWPFWVHILLWGVLLILTALLLIKPLKALMIFLQYEMRPEDWEKPDEQ